MFSIGYGSAKREESIRKLAETDDTTAVILAAVHFEWMMKRAILKLGCSPTKELRSSLENIYKLTDKKSAKGDYQGIWSKEVAPRFKSSSLGSVLGTLHTLQNKTWGCPR